MKIKILGLAVGTVLSLNAFAELTPADNPQTTVAAGLPTTTEATIISFATVFKNGMEALKCMSPTYAPSFFSSSGDAKGWYKRPSTTNAVINWTTMKVTYDIDPNASKWYYGTCPNWVTSVEYIPEIATAMGVSETVFNTFINEFVDYLVLNIDTTSRIDEIGNFSVYTNTVGDAVFKFSGFTHEEIYGAI